MFVVCIILFIVCPLEKLMLYVFLLTVMFSVFINKVMTYLYNVIYSLHMLHIYYSYLALQS